MYNIIKKYKITLIIILLTLILAGCANSIAEVRELYSDDKIYLESLTFTGMNDEFCNSLNENILKDITDEKERFQEEIKENEEVLGNKLEIIHEIKYEKNNIISVVSKMNKNVGTENDLIIWQSHNIDKTEQKQLLLCDIFNDDEYVDLLNERLEELANDEKYSDIWKTPTISEKEMANFYLDSDGLVIFYPPYELSYYARGVVEFTIPYDDLYGYLKEEYKGLY